MDGYVALGALEHKFWSAFCRGVGREDMLERAFEPPGSDAHRDLCDIFATRTRDQWQAFASEHDCCLEPVLELDEALGSELVAARSMIAEVRQPGAASPLKLLGTPIKLSRTPADPTRAPAPALGEHTDEVLRAARFSSEDISALHASGAVAGPVGAVQGAFLESSTSGPIDR
jgi:crotonobetainyl-CoA:carnitine CoA-transferase CaiB-like acyl-CoA transferase